MIEKRIILPLITLALPLRAEPLPPESYVDFLVVPAGPIRLAEFEIDSPIPATAAHAETPARGPRQGGQTETPAGGNGSGVKVREVDPSEVPPSAVYIKLETDKYLQIPCSLNAIGLPVRTPVKDTEVVFLTKSGDSYSPLEKQTLPAGAGRVLVMLYKPLGEKRWTKPAVTMIPIPSPDDGTVIVANASPTTSCGVVFGGERKFLLPAMKSCTWHPAGPTRTMIAMSMADGTFRQPFFDEYLKEDKTATSLVIAFEVTPQESFRCGKYAAGSIHSRDFRPALVLQERKP